MNNPVELDHGVSAERERRWGRIGGVVGSAFGVGSALVAVGLDGASLRDTGAYPEIFKHRELLAMDVYLAATLAAGFGFLIAAGVYARRSRYPRTDAFGAILLGGVLCGLAGTIALVRVVALVQIPS